MSNLEFNKVFAALLVAGIIGMLSGFFAKKIVVTTKLDSEAFPIEVASHDAGKKADKKPKTAEPILALLAAADIERGQKLSKACAACHSFDKGGSNRIGPNLWNIVNAPKGAVSGFTYSSALMEKGGDWNYQSLNQFLWKPKSYIAGTKMNYIGLKKPNDRAAMIAWLRTLSDNPAAMPSATNIEAEAPKEEPAPEEAVTETPVSALSPEDTMATPETLNVIDTAAGEANTPNEVLMSPEALNAISTSAGDVSETIETITAPSTANQKSVMPDPVTNPQVVY